MNTNEGFDFSSVAVKHQQTMVVKHPQTGDPTPAKITLAGPEHPKHKAITMAAARAIRKQFEKKGKFVPNDPLDDFEDELNKLVACTLSWEGVLRDGKPLECNAANVRELYQSATWLREQVQAFVSAGENFIEAAAES